MGLVDYVRPRTTSGRATNMNTAEMTDLQSVTRGKSGLAEAAAHKGQCPSPQPGPGPVVRGTGDPRAACQGANGAGLGTVQPPKVLPLPG